MPGAKFKPPQAVVTDSEQSVAKTYIETFQILTIRYYINSSFILQHLTDILTIKPAHKGDTFPHCILVMVN